MSKQTIAVVAALSAAGGAAVTAAAMSTLRSGKKVQTNVTTTTTTTAMPPATPSFHPPPSNQTVPTTTTTTTTTTEAMTPTAAAIAAAAAAAGAAAGVGPVNPAGLFEYGFPGPVSDLAYRAALISSFDRRTRNPHWVVEHLTPASLAMRDADRRRSVFAEDTGVPPKFRALLRDYHRSGYDRGHQVPAADAKWSQQAMDQTFFLTNMCPQVGDGFNRDYWAHFEDFCRRLTAKYPSVRVVTGPLYLPKRDPKDDKWYVRYEVIGNPPNVAVPTHFYKVIYAEEEDAGTGTGTGTVAVGAFVMPNAPIPNEKPLADFEVPVEAVERASGLEFVSKLPVARRRRLCTDTTCAIMVRDYAERSKALGKEPGRSLQRGSSSRSA